LDINVSIEASLHRLAFLFSMKKKYKYDVFISHAYEDKDEIGNPLYELLCSAGLKVWYSGRDIHVGESLTDKIIHDVIPQSRFGAVIISNNYFKAGWGRKELNALHSIEQIRGYNIILPVWHKVDEETVGIEFPYLVDRFAVQSEKGLDHVAAELIKAITKKTRRKPIDIWILWAIFTAILFLTSTGTLFYLNNPFKAKPSKEIIIKAVKERMTALEKKTETGYKYWVNTASPTQISLNSLLSLVSAYSPDNKCDHSEYFFDNQTVPVRTLQKVSSYIGMNPSTSIYSAYNMQKSEILIHIDKHSKNFSCFLINSMRSDFNIEEVTVLNETQVICKISYQNPLRYVKIEMEGIREGQDCEWEKIQFFGFKPVEEYVFERHGEEWKHTGIK
jgi:hypothetical protein